MSFKFNQNESFIYAGKFWLQENEDEDFSGYIKYTPENGLYLSLYKQKFLFNTNETRQIIFGDVEKIGKITLVACLSVGMSSSLSKNYVSYQYRPIYAIIGHRFSLNENLFDKIIFHFKQLDNFCSHLTNDYRLYEQKNLVCCSIEDFGDICIDQWLQDEKAINLHYIYWGEKEEQINNIFDNTSILFKPYYGITIKTPPTTFGEIIKKKTMLERLFSVFLMEKVEMDFCEISINGAFCPLIFNIPNDLTRECIMEHMPISIYSIKDTFQNIFQIWMKLYSNPLLIDCLLNRLYRNCGNGYQQFNVILAQCAFFQMNYGLNKDSRKRYENFVEETLYLETNFSTNIETSLSEFFEDIPLDNNDRNSFHHKIGHLLSVIRDYIAHVDTIPETNQKKKLFQKYVGDDSRINSLCEILFVMLIKRIYNELGIKQTENQENNLTYMCRSFEILDV